MMKAAIASLVAVYFHEWFLGVCPGWFITPDLILLWMSVVLTLCALVHYVRSAKRTARERGII